MNSLFGGGPLGTNKQLATSSNSNNANVNGASSNSSAKTAGAGGVGGWGNMFKSALNQVETHLDRYLEIQNEAGTVSVAAAGTRTRQLAHSRSMRSLRQSTDPRIASTAGSSSSLRDDSSSVPPRAQSRASRGTPGSDIDAALSPTSPLSKSGFQPATSHLSRSVDDARVRPDNAAREKAVDVQEDDMDSNLLDAFGIELEGDTDTPRQSDNIAKGKAEAAQTHVQSAAADADTLDGAQLKGKEVQPDTAASNHCQSTHTSQSQPSTSTTQATDANIAKNSADSAPKAIAENPYIQEELRKLRMSTIPDKPEDMRTVIEEYGKRIEALLLEGQQWSAKELRLSNTAKKLRVDSKNYEKAMQLVQKKLDVALSKNEDLSEKVRRASLTDRSTSDSLKVLKARLQETDTQRKTAERELDSLKGTTNALRSALSKAEREASGLHSALATTRSSHSQELQRARDEALREAAQQMADVKTEASASQQRLQAQADELQQRVMAAEEEARDREVALLTQVRTLQEQLRNTEQQNSDRGAEIQQHALPLIQQMEELRARQAEQRREWMRKESELAERARALVQEADNLRTKLDMRAAELAEAQSIAAAEAKATENAKQEMHRVRQQLQTETKIRSDMKRQLEEAHGSVRRLTAKLDELQSSRSRTAADMHHAAALSVSPPSRLAAESPTERGSSAASVAASRHGRNLSVSSVSSTDSRQRRGSAADSASGSSPQASDSATAAHAATKKLGAQIASLKAQLQAALKQKSEFSQSLVELSRELDKARTENSELKGTAKELDELKHRHKTALEMLGEKTEQVVELQQDIGEMKEAYKQQLQSLL
ncbi:hypothetical protein IW140_001094 [Coemansia sp. RSA 1813]|nr:hypothetical protein LPJ74_000865 [Coemansia sp. RSA 1843]KAJ2216660.1 hypothetical protein EV179_001199 [Coemansia sp. RSA 487]KAJ2572054.1 hypothetical protein IW140_001094 [Coemansia sp. RSA 1813]